MKKNDRLSYLKQRSIERVQECKKMSRQQDIKIKGFYVNLEGKHISGAMWSKKNNKEITFRSAYEFAYCLRLEEDDNVKAYFMEAMSIPYFFEGDYHKYIPDLFVVYMDGSSELLEIKPQSMIHRRDVQVKAIAANKFIADSKVKNCKYRFITEEEIFDSAAQYRRFIEALKP